MQVLDNQLLTDPNVRVSSLYVKSLSHFRTQATVMVMYQIAKIIAFFVLFIINLCKQCEYNEIDIWLVLIGIQSTFSLWCLIKTLRIMKNLQVIVKIAEDLHQAIYLPMDENNFIPLNEEQLISPERLVYDPDREMNTQEENKKISVLSMQIKFEASKKNVYLKWINQFTFIFNQALIIFGMVIEFSFPDTTLGSQAAECEGPILIFMFIFLVLSVYQYIDLYVIVALLIVCLPFILIFLAYSMIKQCNQKRKNVGFVDKLKKSEFKYQPGCVQGDQECRICMSAYNLEENVIILPCNNLHHFHANCISAWLKISSSCPLCRKNFGEEDIDNQQQQQLIQP